MECSGRELRLLKSCDSQGIFEARMSHNYGLDSRRSLENLINVQSTCQKRASAADGYAIFLLIIDERRRQKNKFTILKSLRRKCFKSSSSTKRAKSGTSSAYDVSASWHLINIYLRFSRFASDTFTRNF